MPNLLLLAREEGDADLRAKVEHIVQQGMELPGVEIAYVKGLSGRGPSPGWSSVAMWMIRSPSYEQNKISGLSMHIKTFI